MRENPTRTESMFDRLSASAAGGSERGPHEISIGTTPTDISEIERELDDLMASVVAALPVDDIQFDDAIIKENLDEILLMLIAMHGETHGKQLISDLNHLFGAQLSPGTVYPGLHELEEQDVLSMHKKVRTKEYSIADETVVRATVERTMLQHLAFGLLLYSFLPRL